MGLPVVHWYKRDPDAALAGMLGLTPEERGIYNTLIDLLYARNGDVPNDDRFMARAQQCAPQMWRRVRDSLIAKGKIRIKTDGKLTANRVETTLKEAENWEKTQGFLAKNRWETTTDMLPFRNPSTSTTSKEESSLSKDSNKAKNGLHNPAANGQVHVRIDSPHWKACSERYRKQHRRWPPQDDAFGWRFPADWIPKPEDSNV